ncbi:DNA methyltransferase [Reticulibacter mediterranei]|nr:DNA methyltransferase [Reticulibacter mediterranei]
MRNTAPTQGLTHTFYKYPARFSPAFVRAAITEFSQPGDVILDPFMGSGTSLVEALISDRHAIGSDINTLAHFLAQVKTTPLSSLECDEVAHWAASIGTYLRLSGPQRSVIPPLPPADDPSQRGIPRSLRQIIAAIRAEISHLSTSGQRQLARCALLRTSQSALDCTTTFPSAPLFREQFVETVNLMLKGLEELRSMLDTTSHGVRPQIICLNVPAQNLQPALWELSIKQKPTLIVTSPPYPSVHVLYHRWQIKSRREITTPYWITDQLDGHGEAYYMMGSRTPTGLDNYFRTIEASFARLYQVVAEEAFVVQLLAFSHIDTQLPRYLVAMERAGFEECAHLIEDEHTGRIWRRVPLRRWYATYQGNTPSSHEVLLLHRRR